VFQPVLPLHEYADPAAAEYAAVESAAAKFTAEPLHSVADSAATKSTAEPLQSVAGSTAAGAAVTETS
jgi:hypothetical protein